MKHIHLFESWKNFHTHIFNDRDEYEQHIFNWIGNNSIDVEIDDNGNIINMNNDEYIGSIKDDFIIIGDETFEYNPNYKSVYDWASEFERYIKLEGIDYVRLHHAQTGTIYCYFDNLDGVEYKVRFADHSDAYADSDFNFAATEENFDGGNWQNLIDWFQSVKQNKND